MTSIKQFYNDLQFPGKYQPADLATINNRYLLLIDSALQDGQTVLDVGCGTGLIANLFALKYPNSKFTAIDFSESIDYAQQFARDNHITNITFIKDDFLMHQFDQKFDVVICQGVLHHIPDYKNATEKLIALSNHRLVVGLYHPWGKIAKKLFAIDYKNSILHRDQEHHPFELAFDCRQVMSLFDKCRLVGSYPSTISIISHVESLFNYRNGGLITYFLEKIPCSNL